MALYECVTERGREKRVQRERTRQNVREREDERKKSVGGERASINNPLNILERVAQNIDV
jgi:hypothetical protein